jgi:predicted nucleotidyltransferase
LNIDDRVSGILSEIESEAKSIIGGSLYAVILYGSYARGENDPESDLDIMLLADGNDESIKKWDEQFSGIMFNLSLKYDIFVSIMLLSSVQFNKYLDILPFYMNVEREGLKIYERRAA